MHPAPSVIVFTSLSGAGFGLMFWLGLGMPSVTGWPAFAMFFMAFALAVGGLLASTLHLGHPERAHLAFTQWRSSWLSREACASVAALVLMGLFALGAVIFGARWQPLGWLGALASLATVGTTAMIYAQLRTVPRWHQPATPAVFVTLSLGGGALLAGQAVAAVVFLLAAGAAQLWHWQAGATALTRAGHTLETATGLGGIGRVRAFAPPHTGGNYLTREMAFRVARKHALRLRAIGFALAVVLPLIVLLALPAGIAATGIAATAHIAGVLALRWLFFAEAEHVVALYYGQAA